jgi:hypothetical protein
VGRASVSEAKQQGAPLRAAPRGQAANFSRPKRQS